MAVIIQNIRVHALNSCYTYTYPMERSWYTCILKSACICLQIHFYLFNSLGVSMKENVPNKLDDLTWSPLRNRTYSSLFPTYLSSSDCTVFPRNSFLNDLQLCSSDWSLFLVTGFTFHVSHSLSRANANFLDRMGYIQDFQSFGSFLIHSY